MTQSSVNPPRIVHLLSDSTGNLAQHTLTALLTQFPAHTFEVRRHNFCATPTRVISALEDAARSGGLVMHAVVSREHKAMIQMACDEAGLPVCDITEPLVQFLAEHSGLEPTRDVARVHFLDVEYEARIAALEFTMQHDDGLGVGTLDQADIVLVGVSRTSKTPTSILLAQQGFKVANVSLAIEVEPPRELLALTKPSVVGLMIDPMRLCEVRAHRQRTMGVLRSSYSHIEHIEEELAWCKKLFATKGWPSIDVTRRAVEETATKIIDLLGLSVPGSGALASEG